MSDLQTKDIIVKYKMQYGFVLVIYTDCVHWEKCPLYSYGGYGVSPHTGIPVGEVTHRVSL